MKFNLWIEGYSATGEHSGASCIGKANGDTFIEACRNFATKENQRKFGGYSEQNGVPRFWGCKVFDNEGDARRSFG